MVDNYDLITSEIINKIEDKNLKIEKRLKRAEVIFNLLALAQIIQLALLIGLIIK